MKSFLFVLHRNNLVLRPTGLLVFNFVKMDCFKGIKNQVCTRLHWNLIASFPGCVSVSTGLPSEPGHLETTEWHTKGVPLSLAASPRTQVWLPWLLLPSGYTPGTLPASLSRGRAGEPEGFSPWRGAGDFTCKSISSLATAVLRLAPSPSSSSGRKNKSRGPAAHGAPAAPSGQRSRSGGSPGTAPGPWQTFPTPLLLRAASSRIPTSGASRPFPAHAHPPAAAAPSPTLPWTKAAAAHQHKPRRAQPSLPLSSSPPPSGGGRWSPFAPVAAFSRNGARDGAGKAAGWGVKVCGVCVLPRWFFSDRGRVTAPACTNEMQRETPVFAQFKFFKTVLKFPFQAHSVFFPVRLLFIKVHFHLGTHTQPLFEVWMCGSFCSFALFSLEFSLMILELWGECRGIDESAQIP